MVRGSGGKSAASSHLFGIDLEVMSTRGSRDALHATIPSDVPIDHVEAKQAHGYEYAEEKQDKRTLKLTGTFIRPE